MDIETMTPEEKAKLLEVIDAGWDSPENPKHPAASYDGARGFVHETEGDAITEVRSYMDKIRDPGLAKLAEAVEERIRARGGRVQRDLATAENGVSPESMEAVRVEIISLITELQNQEWFVTDDMVKRAKRLVDTYGDQEEGLAEPAILLADIITHSYNPEERLGGIRTLLHEHPELTPDISLNLGDASTNMPAEVAAATEMVEEAPAEQDAEGIDDAYAPHSAEAVLEADQVAWESRRGHLEKYIAMLEDPARSKVERISERRNLAAAKKALELYQVMLAEAPLETELVGLTRQLLVFHPTTEAEREEQRAMRSRVDELRLKRGEAKARIQDLSEEFKKAEADGELTLDDVLATAQDGIVRKPAKERVAPPPSPEERRRLEKQARDGAHERLTSVLQELDRAREGGDPDRVSLCYANSMKAYNQLIDAYSSAKELSPSERLDLGVIRCDKQIVHHEHQASVFKAERDAATDPKVREEKEAAWMKELDSKKRFMLVKANILQSKNKPKEPEEASGPVTGPVMDPMGKILAAISMLHDPGKWVGEVAGGLLEGKAEKKH